MGFRALNIFRKQLTEVFVQLLDRVGIGTEQREMSIDCLYRMERACAAQIGH
jgi:hypothetical protein